MFNLYVGHCLIRRFAKRMLPNPQIKGYPLQSAVVYRKNSGFTSTKTPEKTANHSTASRRSFIEPYLPTFFVGAFLWIYPEITSRFPFRCHKCGSDFRAISIDTEKPRLPAKAARGLREFA